MNDVEILQLVKKHVGKFPKLFVIEELSDESEQYLCYLANEMDMWADEIKNILNGKPNPNYIVWGTCGHVSKIGKK